MDDVVNTGQIPFSLIRWQMTGLSDEVDRLLPPPGQLSLVPLKSSDELTAAAAVGDCGLRALQS